MVKIRKVCYLKIVALITGSSLLFTNVAYSCHPKYSLRVPIGEKATSKSMSEVMREKTNPANIYFEWDKLVKDEGKSKIEALQIILEDNYDIDFEVRETGIELGDDFIELIVFLLSLVPDEVLEEYVSEFCLGGPGPYTNRDDYGNYDADKRRVTVTNRSIRYWDLFNFARQSLHELGHGFEMTLSKEERSALRKAFEILVLNASSGYQGYSLLLKSDSVNILDHNIKWNIFYFISDKQEDLFVQFIAEFFRQYILNGDEVRELIKNQSDASVKKSLDEIYKIYKTKFGIEFTGKELKDLGLDMIFYRLKKAAGTRIEKDFQYFSKNKGIRHVFFFRYGISLKDYTKIALKRILIKKSLYELIHAKVNKTWHDYRQKEMLAFKRDEKHAFEKFYYNFIEETSTVMLSQVRRTKRTIFRPLNSIIRNASNI